MQRLPLSPPLLPTLRDGALLLPAAPPSLLRLLFLSLFCSRRFFEGAFYESKVPNMGRSKDSNAPGCDFISSFEDNTVHASPARAILRLVRQLPAG